MSPRDDAARIVLGLAGREEIRPDPDLLSHTVRERCVLITGAAGSIGSELSRETCRHGPRRLVLLDQAESDLYAIGEELARLHPGLDLVPVVGDIRHRASVELLMRTHTPDTLCHAAAYKHVPLMEHHALEAARTNILGTWNLLQAATRHGVSDFLNVSTDKAVRPSSVMGATKRAAELLVAWDPASLSGAGMRRSSIRLGNVVGSRASVVPAFGAQIASGGPVRVTDPEARRFFMTLREAAGMILASAGLAAELAPGEASSLFVPDPGTPVRILDLAEAMIRGAGLVPGQDIEIRIVGLRPGEKVVEELVLESEILAGTRAGWLRRASSPPVPSARLETFVANLERALEHPDPEGILRCLGDLPSGPRWPGATPTPQGSGERAFIPFSRPAIGPEEIGEVVDTLESGWITTGPKTARFEELFGEYIGVPAAVAVSSGTAGLHLALTALGLGPGDEVITSPLTFCATVNTILETGATPVLADVGEDFNLDPEAVCRQVTERTRAIVPVHYGGLPCRMHQIWALARERGLRVVEDAAHAVGSHYGGFPVGAGNPSRGFRSDATCFSFYATKNLTTGEGGMVVTHDPELAARMRVLSLHGISRDAWRRRSLARDWHYEVVARGFKYNLGDIQSAIGIHQLAKQEQFVRIRTRWAGLYNDAFRGIPGIETPPDSEDARHSWHLYALRLDPDRLDIGRDEFIEALGGKGVGASVHFIPIPMHPAYADLGREMRNHCPRALDLYPRLVSLPLYPTLGASGVAAVIGAVLETVAAHRKN